MQALASADLAEADVMIGRTERIAERSQEPDTGAITQRDVDFLLTVASLVRTRRPEARLDEVVADGIGLLQPYAGRAVLNAGAVTFHGVVDDYLFQACRALSQPEATGWRHLAESCYQRIGATWWRDRLGAISPAAWPAGSDVELRPDGAGGQAPARHHPHRRDLPARPGSRPPGHLAARLAARVAPSVSACVA